MRDWPPEEIAAALTTALAAAFRPGEVKAVGEVTPYGTTRMPDWYFALTMASGQVFKIVVRHEVPSKP